MIKTLVSNTELKEKCKGNSALNPDLIMEVCCEIGKVRKKDVLSRKRHGDIVLARQMAMYFTYHYGYNHSEVGELFDRDHTYSVYVIQQIDGKLDHDSLERRFFEEFAEYFPMINTHWFNDDGSAGVGVSTGYVKRKDRKKMSIVDNMIGLCMDASKILKLSGTTRSTQGSLEVTDIPAIMRKRMSEKEQEELLGLMEHKQAVEAQPKEFRLDLNIMGENLSKKELADLVEDVSVRIRDGQASGQLFSKDNPVGYYALVSKTSPGYGEG